MYRNSCQRAKGFSLIELMIVVAIIAIIAAIAYPAYMGYAQRSNRSDAKVALTSLAQRLERCYTTFSSYNNASCSVVADLNGGPLQSDSRFYTITGVFTADSFTLTAAAATTPQTSDTPCLTLTLDNTGARSGTTDTCW